MRRNWKSGLLIAALAAATAATPAIAQVGVIIGQDPPPMRYERRGPMPGQGYTWVDGYWAIQRGRYVWVPGHWERPPYAGAYWSHPHYDRYEDGWHYHRGHWDRDDNGDHYWDNYQNRGRDRDRDRDRDHDRDDDRH